jgi:hypothetical protein
MKRSADDTCIGASLQEPSAASAQRAEAAASGLDAPQAKNAIVARQPNTAEFRLRIAAHCLGTVSESTVEHPHCTTAVQFRRPRGG